MWPRVALATLSGKTISSREIIFTCVRSVEIMCGIVNIYTTNIATEKIKLLNKEKNYKEFLHSVTVRG